MSDSRVVAAVHLVATSKEARDKIYSQLLEIVEYTRAQEPEVTRYAICVPDDGGPTTDTTIYIFEEYANKAVFDAHMASGPVTDLLKFLQTEPSPVTPETSIKHLSWVPGAFFERTSRLPSASLSDTQGRVEKPFVLWATITDPKTADIDTLAPYGAAVVKYAQQNEPDTIFYSDAKLENITPDDNRDVKGGFIAALEIYASKAAWVAHLNDETVKALTLEANRLESTFTLAQLSMVEGWLTR